ncbi:MAG: Lon protease family protein [Elusimicrobiota bacterium]
MTDKPYELKPEELRKSCNPDIFKFETTEEIEEEKALIGQERAVHSIDFGLNMKGNGYNIYVSGIPGTGRNTTILRKVKEIAKNEPAPEDICYLHNFENPDEPKALKLPSGVGFQLHKDTQDLIEELEEEMHKAFTGKEYEEKKKEVIEDTKSESERLTSELEEYAQSKGFTIQQTLTGLTVIPLKDGKPMKKKDYEKLSDQEKKDLEERQKEIYDKIYSYSRKVKGIQKKTRKQIEELDKKIAMYVIGHLIDDLKEKYDEYEIVVDHLDRIVDDILNNLDQFKKEEQSGQLSFMQARASKKNILNKYKVNLLVEHNKSEGAPVVVEQNPTYHNLIGKTEYKAQFGFLSTDFNMIKPGAVHKANGGYLILQAMDILKDYYAWEALKKIIDNKEVKIESLRERFGLVSTETLKPEPVSVDLKIIIIGNPVIYHLLYIYDEEFKKLFKVKADFDTTMRKNEDLVHKYARFIAEKTKKEKLLPFENHAVAEIVDYSSRISDHKRKLTARFIEIADIIRESDYWAKKEDSEKVARKHVKKALDEKIYRSNLIEDKIRELIEENTLFVDTDGEKEGQINGLSVVSLGDYMFGRPSRITARTYVGKKGVINIEREAKMSGKIHSKGVMILGGYMGDKYGQDKPLTFSASICFEQSYSGVDGDSASSTELYSILSSLSEVPLRQDIAVTGSLNQKGEIQPVGGINQKIEGFFKVCKIKGITGKQGVIIPKENVKHLMLSDEVIESVKQEKFHIYPIEHVDQGIEILTGVKAGQRKEDGTFPKDTINYRVDNKLKRFSKVAKEFGEKEKGK